MVLETVLARVLLGETVIAIRWVGAFCVACGVALLANVIWRLVAVACVAAAYQILAMVACSVASQTRVAARAG